MYRVIIGLAIALLAGCAHKAENADLVIHNAVVYTLDENNTVAEAIAVKDGKILETGAERYIMNKYSAGEYLDAMGRAVYPGFIDAHCHIQGYGQTFLEVDLRNCTSWDEVVKKTLDFAAKNKGAWIKGRGWDQNAWAGKQFPTNDLLNRHFPNTPVFLSRVDGHAAIVNNKALALAGITPATTVNGGTIIVENNMPTGILVDNAMDLVTKVIPRPTEQDIRKSLVLAYVNTASYGLTTLCDAGSTVTTFKTIEKLQDENKYLARVYGMLVPDKAGFDFAAKNKHYSHDDKMFIRSFKIVSDGALGSRGACLKHPYSDAPATTGKLLLNPHSLDSILGIAYDLGYQVNTHCIGDSANATLLKLYATYLEKPNDLRWRIEHAQVMDLKDMHYFADYTIIPSVQPTHAVSDMPWAADRVGAERIKGGYVYRQLLAQNGILALGTDFPVEEISPFKTFYAAVARRYYNGTPIAGLQPETLSREEALFGMTKWAALAAFMEDKIGTLEKGKFADIVILDRDILKVPEKDILNTLVMYTFINGVKVHSLE